MFGRGVGTLNSGEYTIVSRTPAAARLFSIREWSSAQEVGGNVRVHDGCFPDPLRRAGGRPSRLARWFRPQELRERDAAPRPGRGRAQRIGDIKWALAAGLRGERPGPTDVHPERPGGVDPADRTGRAGPADDVHRAAAAGPAAPATSRPRVRGSPPRWAWPRSGCGRWPPAGSWSNCWTGRPRRCAPRSWRSSRSHPRGGAAHGGRRGLTTAAGRARRRSGAAVPAIRDGPRARVISCDEQPRAQPAGDALRGPGGGRRRTGPGAAVRPLRGARRAARHDRHPDPAQPGPPDGRCLVLHRLLRPGEHRRSHRHAGARRIRTPACRRSAGCSPARCMHLDSVGSAQLVSPGQLNLMTAGHGIAHSERSPAGHSPVLHGVQLWTALPDAGPRGGPPLRAPPASCRCWPTPAAGSP